MFIDDFMMFKSTLEYRNKVENISTLLRNSNEKKWVKVGYMVSLAL